MTPPPKKKKCSLLHSYWIPGPPQKEAAQGKTALSLFLPGGHRIKVPAAPLSKHALPKLGPSVNERVSTVKIKHKRRLENSLSRQNQFSQRSKA